MYGHFTRLSSKLFEHIAKLDELQAKVKLNPEVRKHIDVVVDYG